MKKYIILALLTMTSFAFGKYKNLINGTDYAVTWRFAFQNGTTRIIETPAPKKAGAGLEVQASLEWPNNTDIGTVVIVGKDEDGSKVFDTTHQDPKLVRGSDTLKACGKGNLFNTSAVDCRY